MELRRNGSCLEIKLEGSLETKLLHDVLYSALIANYYWQEASVDLNPDEEKRLAWENVVLSTIMDELENIEKELSEDGEK